MPLSIDRRKFEALLKSRGMGISDFASSCGISRQSLYNMFKGRSIFSTTFEKVLLALNVDFDQIISRAPALLDIFARAPASIQRTAATLHEFAANNEADLFLIGSRAKGKEGVRADWDFGVFFSGSSNRRNFVKLKERMEDISFPHRAHIVNLGEAPEWFLSSVSKDAIRMAGKTPSDEVFDRRHFERSSA